MYRLLFLIITSFIISSCSNNMKHKVGLATTGPDEYKVQKNKSLEVPPHYELSPPLQATGGL